MHKADVAVIGAGPAGIGAALAAARSGAKVVLIDENAAPGGHLRWTLARQVAPGTPLDGLRGVEIAEWSAGALHDASVEVYTNTVAWGLLDQGILGVASNDVALQLQVNSIIVASGATDIMLPFPGWERPGVLTATAALRMMHLDRVLPGENVVVVGGGALADTVAADVVLCGAEIARRVEGADGLVAGGRDSVEWIESNGTRYQCDAVVIAFGRQPDGQLALQAQVTLEFSTEDRVFVPTRSETLETSVSGLYVIGDASGIGTAAHSFAEGTVAGLAASCGDGLEEAINVLRGHERMPTVQPHLADIADSTVVCRCEEVAAGTVRQAIADGSMNLNDLKRRTRAGMGICQGIYCHRTVAGMLSRQAGIALETIVPMTARPPARMISMAALADSLG